MNTHWRVRFVGILIILLFAGFAFYYFRLYVSPKKYGIILFVAPGTTPELFAEASKQHLEALSNANQTIIVQGNPQGDYASLMTFLASGARTEPGRLGIDSDGHQLDTLLYRAQRKGRNVGIISSTTLTSPGVAAFFSHTTDAFDKVHIALQIFDSTSMDMILGADGEIFNEVQKTMGRDLFKEAGALGYHILRAKDDLEDFQAWLPRKIFGIFSEGDLPFRSDPVPDIPILSDLVRRAIQKLQYNLGGYFLIIEHGLVAKATLEDTPQEIVELDDAVKTALAYAGKNTLVMVYFPSSELGWFFIYNANFQPSKSIVNPGDVHQMIRKEL